MLQVESDPTKVSHAYEQAVSELMVLRRSAVVNQIYGGLPLCIEEESHVGDRTLNVFISLTLSQHNAQVSQRTQAADTSI